MKRILILDDDKLVTKSLARLLEREGYSIGCAESGSQAMELVKESDFDLVVSDIRMPAMSGIEAAKNINSIMKQKNKKQIPIIFITGYSDEKNHEAATELEAADFIYKPFDKDKFLGSVKTALGNQ